MKNQKFNPGCYFDGSRGIYLIDALAEFAESKGFDLHDDDPSNPLPESLSDYQFSGEIEDDIDEFFNENFPKEGYYWGRSEQGD